MIKRLLLSSVAAVAIAASFPTSLAAGNPHSLICLTPSIGEIYIVIENFGGVGHARRHCVEDWNGVVIGITK